MNLPLLLQDGSGANFLRIADLGSAGGVNAIKLLKFIEDIFRGHNENRPVEYFFEDLPTSDYNELIKTIHDQYIQCFQLIKPKWLPNCFGFLSKITIFGTLHVNSVHVA